MFCGLLYPGTVLWCVWLGALFFTDEEADLEMLRHIQDQQQHKAEWFFLSLKLVFLLYIESTPKTSLLKDKKVTRSYSLDIQLNRVWLSAF